MQRQPTLMSKLNHTNAADRVKEMQSSKHQKLDAVAVTYKMAAVNSGVYNDLSIW